MGKKQFTNRDYPKKRTSLLISETTPETEAETKEKRGEVIQIQSTNIVQCERCDPQCHRL